MREIPLGKRRNARRGVAIVDDADFEKLASHSWSLHITGYAYRSETTGGRQRMVLMHREIVTAPAGFVVDHIDGDRRNNVRSNLRVCTHAENLQNQRIARDNSVGRKGVRQAPSGRFAAKICVNYRVTHLGTFATADEAAHAYDTAARALHGEYAALNNPAPGERSALIGDPRAVPTPTVAAA
jgi:hypothetical protein